jgi:hypothetical protein
MSIPGLPQGNRSKVFRRICQQLRTDPVLSTVVTNWDTYAGESADQMPGNIMQCPYIKLLPLLGSVGWYAPDAQMGPLDIQIQAGVDGLDAADCLDLWDAFERAIYPYQGRDKQLAFEAELVSLGAETGQIQFSRPASIAELPNANSGLQYTLLGMMQVNIVRPFSP